MESTRVPSDLQILASRENGAKSRGPKTAEGKAKSCRNALKHGLCSKVIHVPDENPEVVDARLEDWNEELNPENNKVNAYMVAMMVRHSINLDRCHAVTDAKVAQLARDASKIRDEEVERDVEDLTVHLNDKQQYFEKKNKGLRSDYLKIGPPPQPGHTVRRLKATSTGCNRLILEWELLRQALIDPPTWDDADRRRATNLLGLSTPIRGENCSPVSLPTIHINNHREVATKLEHHLHPNGYSWNYRYSSNEEVQTDLDRIGDLTAKGEAARDQLKAMIDDQQAELRALAEVRSKEEALERSEATYRARFDGSNEGKLMHRYQSDQQRGFLKILGELRAMSKQSKQAVRGPAFKPEPTEADDLATILEETPPVSRKEPGQVVSMSPAMGSKVDKAVRKRDVRAPRKGRKGRRDPQ